MTSISYILAPSLFQLVIGKLQTGVISTAQDYHLVQEEIAKLEYRIPIFRDKIDSGLEFETALIKLFRILKSSINCLHNVLETLLSQSAELFIDCFIIEIKRLNHVFKTYFDQFLLAHPSFDPDISHYIPLVTLYPELYAPVPPPFPKTSQVPAPSQLLRFYQEEIEKRGGIVRVRDFSLKIAHLKSLRQEMIRLDGEDLGSLVFRRTLYRRITDTMSTLTQFSKDVSIITPREIRVHAYVFQADFTQLVARLDRHMVYRVTGNNS